MHYLSGVCQIGCDVTGRLLSWGAAVAGLTIIAWLPVAAEDRPLSTSAIVYDAPRQIATLEHQEILESSGIAASRRTPGVFWTHNDSGDEPRMFSLDESGKHLGMCTLRGAAAIDWEDIAAFERAGRNWLVVADVGDNFARRGEYQLYLIDEPDTNASTVNVEQTIRFCYDVGARNCEAIGVDAAANKLLLVSKRTLDAEAFEMDLPDVQTSRVLTARSLARLSIPYATGMDVSPDGLRALVINYAQAFEFTRAEQESWAAAFSRPPRVLDLPPRKQGESICYGLDGRTLYLTSEKLPTPLWRIAPVSTPSVSP